MQALLCVPGSNSQAGPPRALPRRREQPRRDILPALSNLRNGSCTQQIHQRVQQVGSEGLERGTRQQRKEWQEEGCLVVDAAIVGGDIVGVEKDALLHCGVLESPVLRIVAVVCTSLEAGDGRRQLNAAGEQAGEGGKDRGQRQAQCRCSAKEEPCVLGGHDLVKLNATPWRLRVASWSSAVEAWPHPCSRAR
jgi:hypothetical protein